MLQSATNSEKNGGYKGGTTCEWGFAPDTKHMVQCPLFAHPCSLDDLLEEELCGRLETYSLIKIKTHGHGFVKVGRLLAE